MDAETLDDRDSAATNQDARSVSKRERSTIEFPYADLENAIEIAQTIHDRVGTTSCESRQLAVWLNQTPTSGTFRSRLSAARIFGLIDSDRGQGQISLTRLGRDIIDDVKGPEARSIAFLEVSLYHEMYEAHEGHALPPAAAIERQMIQLGVAKKQAERARQVFSKSAGQANYIDSQTGRFIKPATLGPLGSQNQRDRAKDRSAENGNDGDSPPHHPFIQGLLNELPTAGSEWPSEKRKLWLSTAESIFRMIYKDSDSHGDGKNNKDSEPHDS